MSSISPKGSTLRHQSQDNDAPEMSVSADPEHVSSGDFDGEKVFIPTEANPADLPQPTSTLVNTDPRSAPQVVGIEDGNSPPQAYVVNSDPKSFLQAAGSEDDKDGRYMGAVGAVSSATHTPGISEGEGTAAVAEATSPPRKWYRKRRFLALIGVVVLVVVGLAVGLGVGLTQGNRSAGDDQNDDNGGPSTNDNSTISCEGGLCPAIISATQFDGTLAVFARTSNHRLTVRTRSGDAWSSQWTDLGETSFTSQPAAVSWDPDGNGPRLDVFAVGSTDNRVYGSHKVGADGSWSPWQDLGPGAGSPVAVCRPRQDRIDLWTTDVDSGNITHNYWAPAAAVNTGAGRKRQVGEDEPDEDEPDENEPDEDESPVSTTSISPPPPPSPTSGNDGVTGSFVTSDGSGWPAINPPLGPVTPGGLAVACRDTSVMHDLVWYDPSSPLARHASYDSSTSSWSSAPPRSFSASFVGTPALFSFSDNSLDFFGVDANSSLRHFSWTAGASGGGFSDLEDLGGDLASVPAAISVGGGGAALDVVALGTSGRLVHLHFDGQRWADDWEDLDIEARSAPTMALYGGEIIIFALSEQGTLMASSLDNSTEAAEWASLLRTEDLGGDLTLEYYILDS